VLDVVVVGLGAMGSAALYHLARRGTRALGLEQAQPGHEGGSSHGDSRAIRLAYFENPAYVPLVRRAYENWRELEARTGERVLTVTGVLEAGGPGSELLAGTLASCDAHQLPHERLSAAEVRARFPAFDLPPDWDGVFQPDGGFLRPEAAIRAHLTAAEAMGAAHRADTRVAAIEPTAAGVRLVLADGERIEAGAAIVAAGPWMGELAPELAGRLTLTRQVLAWFEPRRPQLTAPGRFPVFVLETADDLIYGFPDFAGEGVKAASHRPGRLLGCAGDARQDATPEDARAVQAALERLIPAAAGPVRKLKTCIYTSTADGDFIICPHPQWPQIVLASPCSGHGFKFSSVIGEILADLAASGATPHDISRFALSRLTG
jgi:sarcosine oxidase